MKRGKGKIRKRRPRTKKVLSQSGFVLRCCVQFIREREREKERERERNTSQTEQLERKERIHMHEKCMNMRCAKNKLHHV